MYIFFVTTAAKVALRWSHAKAAYAAALAAKEPWPEAAWAFVFAVFVG